MPVFHQFQRRSPGPLLASRCQNSQSLWEIERGEAQSAVTEGNGSLRMAAEKGSLVSHHLKMTSTSVDHKILPAENPPCPQLGLSFSGC